jgi:hypothetical protein
MDRPVGIKRIDQISHKRRPSSFEVKDDPVHTRLLDLFWDDPVADMSTTARRGIANNVHFLLMREFNDMVVGNSIKPADVYLIYHYDKLKECHRTKLSVVNISRCGGSLFTIRGEWVSNRTQALDSLRKVVVEAMIHGVN